MGKVVGLEPNPWSLPTTLLTAARLEKSMYTDPVARAFSLAQNGPASPFTSQLPPTDP